MIWKAVSRGDNQTVNVRVCVFVWMSDWWDMGVSLQHVQRGQPFKKFYLSLSV